MPVITFGYEDLLSLFGRDMDIKEFAEKIPMIGVSVEKIEGNEVSIEVFPNRPDLLSVEGMARAMRAFFGIESGLKRYEVEPPEISLTVDKSVRDVRPYVVAGVVKNVEMTDELIASLMEMQEKLHLSVGKGRKKMAIGVHDFDKVTPPFVYRAVKPDEISFVPLAMEERMNLAEILARHEKGIAYAHILNNFEKYPVILDRNGEVLSFPPIINGQLTALNEQTKNIFIDVTGTDRTAITTALTIVATALAERGGILQQVEVVDDEPVATPDLSPQHNELHIPYVQKLLHLQDGESICEALQKMGHHTIVTGDTIMVESPVWRPDILHPVDLIEDIAIGYGYEVFEEELPHAMTFGSSLHPDRLHQIMIGLGFNEVVTLSLSNPEKEFEKMGIDAGETVELSNPISVEHTIVKRSLLPSLLEILSKNRHNDLPQRIYEIGDVVIFEKGNVLQKTMLSGMKIDAKASFTECKSFVEALVKNLGFTMDVREEHHPSFIEGRCASVLINGTKAGYFGELTPQVICNFDLEHPVIAFEIDLSALFSPHEK
ncbi:MAG: phenylalanine--tRNA ligase subunit beta [Thermoplasmata archaeon]|nr:MAG: phenylalanine--tRNA ligase subunit beta [Thermoplasmata archaeon]